MILHGNGNGSASLIQLFQIHEHTFVVTKRRVRGSLSDPADLTLLFSLRFENADLGFKEISAEDGRCFPFRDI